jgi:hypothetical protein
MTDFKSRPGQGDRPPVPHCDYAGTADGRGTRPKLDPERLTLMSMRSIRRSLALDVELAAAGS